MRFAERCWRSGVVLALCAGAVGCASVGSMFKADVPLGGPPVSAAAAGPSAAAPMAAPTVTPATPGPSAPAAASPAPALTRADAAASPAARAAAMAAPSSSTLPAVYGAEPEAQLNPAVQRAYDEARRLMRAGRTDDAEKALRTLAQAHPDLGGPHANLGALYRQAGKLPEAVTEGELAVRANPKQPLYFNQLGISHRHNGQFDKARQAYEAALSLDPAYAAALLNLGILHDLYLADGPRALELYDRYLALSPGGDAVVAKWVADLKNRKPRPTAVGQKEKP